MGQALPQFVQSDAFAQAQRLLRNHGRNDGGGLDLRRDGLLHLTENAERVERRRNRQPVENGRDDEVRAGASRVDGGGHQPRRRIDDDEIEALLEHRITEDPLRGIAHVRATTLHQPFEHGAVLGAIEFVECRKQA